MLAYAAHRRRSRQISPSTLILIVGAHAVAVGLLAAAKMDVPLVPEIVKTKIFNVPEPLPPEPLPPPPRSEPAPQLVPPPPSTVDRVPPVVPLPIPGPTFDPGTNINTTVPEIGPAIETPLKPAIVVPQPSTPVRVAARAITPSDLLRPPYPESKRRSEEETVLRLRLSIDARGRVVGVEPAGSADPAFVASARTHLMRHWRYRPATEDGQAVATSLVITLRFELED